MNEILIDSLIKRNKGLYTGSLSAIEQVMGNDFKKDKRFGIIRNLILRLGNETERSIKTELDSYHIVKKEDKISASKAVDIILNILPSIQFGFYNCNDCNVPMIKISSSLDDTKIIRHAIGCGIIIRDKGKPTLEICGTKDCLEILPMIDSVMSKVPNNQTYKTWVQELYQRYREID